VLLVGEGPWDYGQLWVQLGIAALAGSTILGIGVFGPGWARVNRLAQSEAPVVPTAGRRLLVASWLDLGLLVAAIWAMTVKPDGRDAGGLLVAAAIPVVCLALGVGLTRAPAQSAVTTGRSAASR
jgi:hypothetical protein